jgi:hypothetical protein
MFTYLLLQKSKKVPFYTTLATQVNMFCNDEN